MATLKELIAQKEAVEREIDQQQRQDRGEAIAKIRSLMGEHGLTAADLFGKAGTKTQPGTNGKTRPSTNGKVAAKYRDSATGASWSGRGLQPKWLKAAVASGRQVTDFAV